MEKALRGKYYLKCVSCGREFNSDPDALTCPDCGEFDGTLDVLYDYERIWKKSNITFGKSITVFKEFSDILPFSGEHLIPPLKVGDTPLYKISNSVEGFELSHSYIKDDTINPSGSFKDRATAVAIAMAKESGKNTIAVASTGNAAASTAALAASSGMRAVLFVPASAPTAKLTQLYIYGAKVLKFKAQYDEIFDLCGECSFRFNWYNRNTVVNPFTGEGKKTAALEIYRDLGKAPDNVIVPVGDGCILSGTYKGFFDLLKIGLIEKMPRLFGIQAEGCSPLVKAFKGNGIIEKWGEIDTNADSIAVGFPRDGTKALRSIRETKGAFASVNDGEIFKAQYLLARTMGIYAEPSAAASFGGFIKLLRNGIIDDDAVNVILITGNGLKDVGFTGRYMELQQEDVLEPNIEAVIEKLDL